MRAGKLAFLLFGLALGVPLVLLAARLYTLRVGPLEIHGRVAERGGWAPEHIRAAVGQELVLRLTSDDVVHGFAVGQHDSPAIDVFPGQVVETTLTFSEPGKYVYYCTRWCGPGHWRMRGTIEVEGSAPASEGAPPAPDLALELDLDAPHPADPAPAERPSATRGAALFAALESPLPPAGDVRSQSPATLWSEWRGLEASRALSDQQLWDLVAYGWRSGTGDAALQEGERLYAVNCAACHGESGGGDGVMADSLITSSVPGTGEGHGLQAPTDFTDQREMLGAHPAVLQGKIVRGGMGTGMPYWGPIFTTEQTWALVDYLWSFSFVYREMQ